MKSLLGQRIIGIRRVLFLYNQVLDETVGPIELTTDRTGPVVFDAGPDGEALVMRSGAWSDPFESKDDEVSLRFIEEHGKWIGKDVSAIRPWSTFVGSVIDDVQVRVSARDASKVVGATLQGSACELDIRVEGDELVAVIHSR
jgi:hypothetical protein